MSLINQMLQELDARGNQAALGGVLQGQVRAVPQSRSLNLVWSAAILAVCLLCAGGLWAWLDRSAPLPSSPRSIATPPAPLMRGLSLKVDDVLDTVQESSASVPPVEPDVRAVSVTSSAPAQSGATSPAPAPIQAAAPALAASSSQAPAPTIAQTAPASVKTLPSADEGLQKTVRANARESEHPAVAVKETPPTKLVTPPAAVPVIETPAIAKQVKELTPRQLAENEYRKASGLIQQGRSAEAVNSLEQTLQLDSRHAEARQTLAALLIQSRRQEEAIRVLREGLQLDVTQSGLAMILARLQLERSELKPAIETLQRSLPYAAERADYPAFLAALLQRDGRHRDAIDYYAQALRKSPGNAVWWMGQGISLQAENRIPEAIEAYKRAKTANGLSAELRAFVEDRLNSL